MASLDPLWSKRLLWLRDLATSVALARSEVEVCERAAHQLAQDASGISFALLYLLDDGDDSLTLCESVGLAAGTKDHVSKVSLAAADAEAWTQALAVVLRSGQPAVLEAARESEGSHVRDPWPTLPALVVPIYASEPAN